MLAHIDDKYLEFCTTVHQETVIKDLIITKSHKKSAQRLGLTKEKVRNVFRHVQSKAAIQGYSPEHDMTKTAPDTHFVKGTSTYYDLETGIPKRQWVKTDAKAERIAEDLCLIADELKQEIPKAEAVARKAQTTEDALVNTYVITDYHLGMTAWGEETKDADWDTQKSEDMLVKWFTNAIALSPCASTAIFAQLGDFLHFDSIDPVTPTSKHIMDTDSRYQALVRIAIRVIVKVTKALLEKYDNVHLLMAEGNHDISSSIWLREFLAHYFENDPRVTVDINADPYYCYEHGDTSLFFHHGHKKRLGQISSVFVSKFRDVFGRTKHSYAHMGHMHHVDVKENNLMIVEQHQTLSAKDAHCSRGGWASGRSASVITYHKKYGEVARQRLSPDYIEDLCND